MTSKELAKNSKGVKAVRIDYAKRSAVKITGFDGSTLKTYRMNNIADYEHPMLSWNNLLLCNGFACEDHEVIERINAHQKFAGTISVETDHKDYKEMEAAANAYGLALENYGYMLLYEPWQMYDGRWNWVLLCIPETHLDSVYDLDEIRDAYEAQGCAFSDREWKELEALASENIPAWSYDVQRPTTDIQLVATGLLFGYPIESTASILLGY